jgi:transposase InsO family protein
MWDNVIVIFEVLIRHFIWLMMPARRTQEILMLRKELQVLKRGTKRPKLTSSDRLFFVSLLRLNERVVANIVTISPNTVLAWHRKLAARRWTVRQKSLGRPVTEDEVRNLVIEMKTNNPRWGARRIVGELRKLGKSISKSTVLNILKASGLPSGGPRQDQSWYRFLRSHGQRFFACDFLTVDTAFLRPLYVFALMDTSNRQIISIAVTKNPTAVWLETVVRNAFMDMGDTPKFMVSDRDGIYGAWFGKFLSDCYDITLYRTPPRTPNCNAYIERWNRTVREELLDHRIIFGERDLRRLLREYVDYFNQARPHQSLGQDSPCRQHGVVGFERSKVRRQRLVDGLIVSYSMAV